MGFYFFVSCSNHSIGDYENMKTKEELEKELIKAEAWRDIFFWLGGVSILIGTLIIIW